MQEPPSTPDGGALGDPIEMAIRSPSSGDVHLGSIKMTTRFIVTYSGEGEVCDATLNVSPPPGILAEPSRLLLPPIKGRAGECLRRDVPVGSGPVVVDVVFMAERGSECLPSSLVGQASVVYTRGGDDADGIDATEEALSARCDVQLPFAMCARLVETAKGGEHKFTFSTNRPPVSLPTLFEDMIASHRFSRSSTRTSENFKPEGEGSGVSASSVASRGGDASGGEREETALGGGTSFTFRFWAVSSEAGASRDASVSVSKNSGKYRVQGKCFPALCVLAIELLRRLRQHFGDRDHGEDTIAREGTTSSLGKLFFLRPFFYPRRRCSVLRRPYRKNFPI